MKMDCFVKAIVIDVLFCIYHAAYILQPYSNVLIHVHKLVYYVIY